MKTIAKRIQVNITVRRPQGVKVSNELLNAAIQQFIKHGIMPSGMEISLVVWENEPRGTYEYDEPDKIREVLAAAQNIDLLGGDANFTVSVLG